MGFEFRMLGPLEVSRDGVPVEIRAGRLRALVVALLLDANRVVTVDTLIARLWGERPPGGARNAVQNYVLRVRRLLGEPCPLLTHAHGYLLRVDEDALDLHRFDALVSRGRAEARPERAAALLAEALGLWRGRPLADVGSEALRAELEPVLDERWRCAVELRVEADLRLGRHADILGELRELTGAHPLQERFWAQRMLALHRSGRQAEALRCYHEAARLLADELGVDPGPELRELHRRMLNADPGLEFRREGPAPQRRGNLPAETTSFVGRERELARAARLLGEARLVTMTGAGGVGKTRLALRAAARAVPDFPDGVWLVDLAPLSDPALLALTVAEALGIRDQSARPGADVLRDHLRDRQLLLVLDNCEHLVDAVAALTGALLRSAAGPRVLATSRIRLGVPGEHVLPVPPLDVADAVRLLADRGAASAPGFEVTERNRAAVEQLCRRLDGIPLAIELAAVRLDTLSAAQILDRIGDRFRILTAAGDTRRTLRAVVDWSHGLCTEGERLLWARLTVFAGGFDLEAAERVCGEAGAEPYAVLDGLGGLVRKSILTADTGGARPRYLILETLREYGRERLRALGREAEVQARHRDHFADVAARAAREWCGPRDQEWLSLLREELPNLRAALEFSLATPGEAAAGLRLAVDLSRAQTWLFCGTPSEGRHWLERALAAVRTAPPCADAASAAAFVTWLALCQGDRASADAYLDRCRGTARRVPSAAAIAMAAEGAHALLALGDPGSIALLARARDRLGAEGRVGEAHWITLLWTMASAFLGDRDAALRAGEDYLAEAERYGGGWALSWAMWGAALTEMCHGDPGRATTLIRDAIRRQRALGDTWSPIWGVELLAWNLARTGAHEQAARLLGAAHRLRQDVGVVLYGPFRQAHLDAERAVRRSLGEGYAAAFGQGAAGDDPVRSALEGCAVPGVGVAADRRDRPAVPAAYPG